MNNTAYSAPNINEAHQFQGLNRVRCQVQKNHRRLQLPHADFEGLRLRITLEIRQDLERVHNITVSLRTVERAVAPFLRRALRAAEVATVHFETAPSEQMQIDIGETTVSIADERIKLHLLSRRSAIRGAHMSRCSTIGSRHGGAGSRVRFTISVVDHRRCSPILLPATKSGLCARPRYVADGSACRGQSPADRERAAT